VTARLVRPVLGLLLGLAAVSWTTPALADDPAPEVVALEEGVPAPFAGLLLTEAAFEVAARARLQVPVLTAQLASRDEIVADLTNKISVAGVGVPCEEGWWARYGWAVGGVGGLAVAGLLVWATVEVLGARE